VASYQTVPQRAELTLTRYVRNPSPIIFDVGANRGQSYRRFRKLFPDARIWSFEPDPEMFALLDRAMATDALAHAVPAAVGSDDGTATLYRNSRSGTNSLSPMRDDAAWARELPAGRRDRVVARLVTLDSYCAQEEINRIDFAKFDIQGFEPEALKGAQGLLKSQCIELLQLELILAAFYDRVTNFSDVERWLLPHGYRLMTINRIVTDDEGLLRACDVLYGLQRPPLS
jgi:FkbM family methyltransferase